MIFYPQKSRNQKFQTQNKPRRSSLSLEIRSIMAPESREVWKIGDKMKVFDFLGDRNQVWFELKEFRTRAREIGILL